MENLVICSKKKVIADKFFSGLKILAKEDVSRVLNTSAKAVVTSAEVSNGVLVVSGKTISTTVFLSTDGLVCSASAIEEFIQKQKFDFDISDIFVSIETMVESVNYSGSEISVSVSLVPEIVGEFKCQIPDILDDEKFVTQKTNFVANRLFLSPVDNFSVAGEFEISQKNAEVLAESSKIIISEISSTVDRVVVEGKIVSEIVAKEDGDVFSLAKELEFKQEIGADGAVPNMFASANLAVKDAKVSIEIKDDKTMLVCAYDIFAKCYIYESVDGSAVQDMFSLENEIDLTYSYVDTGVFSKQLTLSDTHSTQTNIAEISDFDDIIGVFSPEARIVSIEKQENCTFLTAEISAFALYKTTSSISKIDIVTEAKYEVPKQDDSFASDALASAQILSFKVKAGKELEVVFGVNYDIVFEKTMSLKFIKSFEEKSQKIIDDAGIRVYIASSGQTLFDVAKVLSIKPEVIEAQNEVDGVFEQGQKIYVYSPINLA